MITEEQRALLEAAARIKVAKELTGVPCATSHAVDVAVEMLRLIKKRTDDDHDNG